MLPERSLTETNPYSIELELQKKRATLPETWTFNDATKLMAAQRAIQLIADIAAESATEGKTFRKRTNPHE